MRMTLVDMMVKLDRLFDERSKDGMEPVHVEVDGKLVPIVEVEIRMESNKRIVVLKGEMQ